MRAMKHLSINDEMLTPMEFRWEISMQSYLVEQPDILRINADTDSEVQILGSEISVKNGANGKSGNGRFDLFIEIGTEQLAFVELKKVELNHSHLRQLEGYIKNRDKFIEKYQENAGRDEIDRSKSAWIGILVGVGITESLRKTLINGYIFDGNVPIAALSLKRFKSIQGNTYIITDEYFKSPSKKDYSKYAFNGQSYGKGKLALAVFKNYVAKHSSMNFDELKKVFQNEVQGKSYFDSLEEALEIEGKSGRKRHFIKEDEIVTVGGGKVAVSSQWGIGNLEALLECAEGLGYQIEKVSG